MILIDAITGTGYVQTIKEEGMPIFGQSGRGDLFIEYNVILPKSLSPQMRKRVYISSCPASATLITLFFSQSWLKFSMVRK